MQDSILRFSRPENLNITFLQLFEKKGEGRGRAAQGQGAGRVQGQGTEGRAGLQDSILRFSRPENLKITFLQLFEKKGEGRGRAAQARAKGRAECRAGRAQAGCRRRAQRAGQGCKIPF